MSKSIRKHSSNNCCSKALKQPKAFVFDHRNSGNKSFRPSLFHQFRFGFDRGLITGDSGLGLNDCHLTEAYPYFVNQLTWPQLSSFDTEAPILNPDFPPRDRSKHFYQPESLQVVEASYHRLFRKGLSGFNELTCDSQPSHIQSNFSRKDSSSFAADLIESNNKVERSIRFQDRHSEVNCRKVDGCCHLDYARKPSEALSCPPKKKWIRHYMTGKVANWNYLCSQKVALEFCK